MRCLLIAFLSVMVSFAANAGTIRKCVDSAGRTTFVKDANCPSQSAYAGDVRAYNAAPSGTSDPVKMADPSKPRAERSKGQSYTVIEHKPMVITPTVESAPRKQARPAANQPCVKTVDRLVSGSRKNADGTTTGRAQMVKVVVPC